MTLDWFVPSKNTCIKDYHAGDSVIIEGLEYRLHNNIMETVVTKQFSRRITKWEKYWCLSMTTWQILKLH